MAAMQEGGADARKVFGGGGAAYIYSQRARGHAHCTTIDMAPASTPIRGGAMHMTNQNGWWPVNIPIYGMC